MSDLNNDWLDEELAKLQDIDAPPSLLPKVMQEVRERAARPWWARVLGPRMGLWRSFVLAISILVFALSLVVNPLQIISHLPGVIALMNLVPLLLEAAKTELLRAKIFNYSVLPLLTIAVTLSYILLVASASAIQRLADVRK